MPQIYKIIRNLHYYIDHILHIISLVHVIRDLYRHQLEDLELSCSLRMPAAEAEKSSTYESVDAEEDKVDWYDDSSVDIDDSACHRVIVEEQVGE